MRGNLYTDKLLLQIKDRLGEDKCFGASKEALCALLDCSRVSLFRALREIRDKGLYIIVDKKSCIFFIETDYYENYLNHRTSLEFRGSILLSREENNNFMMRPIINKC
jgi:hypothetical protein